MRIYQQAVGPVEDDVMKKASEYLESKYNESFSLRSFTGVSVDIPYYEMFFQSERFPDKPVRVIGTLAEKFSDDYYGTLIYDEYCGMITDTVNKYIPGAKVFVKLASRGFPDGFNASTSISQALAADGEVLFSSVDIITEGGDTVQYKEAFEGICNEFKDRRMPNHIALYFTDKENNSEITSDNYRDTILRNGLRPVFAGNVYV